MLSIKVDFLKKFLGIFFLLNLEVWSIIQHSNEKFVCEFLLKQPHRILLIFVLVI